MKKAVFVIIALLALCPASASGQTGGREQEKVLLLEQRIDLLEKQLAAYQKNYEKLRSLFLRAIATAGDAIDESGELLATVQAHAVEAGKLETEIEATLADARAVADFLREKTVTRPTLLLETDLTLHALVGGTASVLFVWEPLPWLGLHGGLELWYAEAWQLALPFGLTLRFRLD